MAQLNVRMTSNSRWERTILDLCLRASCRVMMFAKRSEGSPSAEQNSLMCLSYSTSIRVTNLQHQGPQ